MRPRAPWHGGLLCSVVAASLAAAASGCGERARTPPAEPASAPAGSGASTTRASTTGASGASTTGASTTGASTGASTTGATAQGAARAPIDDAQLAKLLREADAHGAVLVTDVATGAVVASVGLGRDAAAPVLPLSVIKLYTSALWWEHDRGEGAFVVRGRHVTVHDMLVDGWDRPGEEMAVELRRALGARAMLAELRGYGLATGLTLPADADDARWGSALSIGEHDAVVTLPIVAGFLRAIGGGVALLRPETRQRLQSAMRDAVERGTARSAGARLGAAGASDWRLGGKTGTGPFGPEPHDGWFAGLIFDRTAPRYTVAVFVERRGPGGGVAAGIAAEITRLLAATP